MRNVCVRSGLGSNPHVGACGHFYTLDQIVRSGVGGGGREPSVGRAGKGGGRLTD
jgi:hypothetical protein